jgi:hypothetical protein
MTVSSEVSRNDRVGDGFLDTFIFEFEIYTKTDIKVWVDGVPKYVDTHFTVPVVGINNPAGGTIVFTGGNIPILNAKIAIILDLPLSQLTDLIEGDKLPAETLEIAMDRLVKLAQALKNMSLNVFKVPVYSTLGDIVVPIAAGEFLAWNAAGTAIVTIPTWAAGDPLPEHHIHHENGGIGEISVLDLSGLLADPQTAVQHALDSATRHSVPTNITTFNVSITAHGLCPIAPNDTTKVLRGGAVPAWGYDKVIQVVNSQIGAVATGTTLLPFDDTIPQKTEGDEYMTLAITPKNASNILQIDVLCILSSSAGAGQRLSAALFQDDASNALAASTVSHPAAGYMEIISFRHRMVAGTVIATTFKVRIGADDAGTTTFNGQTAGRIFGGVMASSITITEIAA